MSNNCGSTARVSIPNNVKKTIQNIKEITGNHCEDDIYSMLKECSMDPNETTQRLLLLDTFHDVKRKRDKRKENMKSRPAEESRGKPGYQGRGIRGARGNSYSQYSSHDVGGRGNTAIRRENGVGESKDKGFRRSPMPMPPSKETDPAPPLHAEKLPSFGNSMNGPVKVPNGSLNGECVPHSSRACDGYLSNVNKDTGGHSSSMPKGSADHALFASDPVLVPSCDSRIPAPVGAIKCEVRIQQVSSGSNEPLCTNIKVGTTEISTTSGTDKHEPQNADEPPITEKGAFDHVNVSQPKIPTQLSTAGNISDLKVSSSPGVEKATSKMEKLKFSDGKHVIIPNHIQVPDAVKNVLSFGSLDANFGARDYFKNGESIQEVDPAPDSGCDETANKLPSCDQDVVTTVPEEQPQSPSQLSEKNSESEVKVASFAMESKDDEPKEESLPAVGPPFPVVQTAPSYSFGFMPPMLVNPLVQPERFESQTNMVNNQNGSAPVSTSSSTPPPAQSVGVAQNSVAMPPQPIAVFRQPYPPNYVPYSHYYPFYVPSTMHPYFGHPTFPPHLPLPGNVYLPSPAAAAAAATASVMKLPPPPYKPGVSVGNQSPISVPSGYAAYSSSQVPITSGNSSTSEDLMPSTLKENIYPGQQSSEGSTMWVCGAGRDAASFPVNSFMNLHPHGHVMTQQAGPGSMVYHGMPPMAGPAPPGLALIQQSQPMAGPAESVGPPTNNNGYQQQQQVNWNM